MHSGYKYAIIALILSLVGLLSIFVLIGIPLSIIALFFGIKSWRYYKNESLLQGKGIALSGILISSFSLLFFVLVIAIIYIPNYYLTKTSAGVSRTWGNFLNLDTVMNAYYRDHHSFPKPMKDEFNKSVLPSSLTTPVAYLKTLYHDPFKNNGKGYYEYGLGIYTEPPSQSVEKWVITSYGPDKRDGNSGTKSGMPLDENIAWSDDMLGFRLNSSGLNYDVTNGITSPGDIYRRGSSK